MKQKIVINVNNKNEKIESLIFLLNPLFNLTKQQINVLRVMIIHNPSIPFYKISRKELAKQANIKDVVVFNNIVRALKKTKAIKQNDLGYYEYHDLFKNLPNKNSIVYELSENNGGREKQEGNY